MTSVVVSSLSDNGASYCFHLLDGRIDEYFLPL